MNIRAMPSTLRLSLFEAFHNLLHAVGDFGYRLGKETLPLWISRSDVEIQNGLDMRSKAVSLFQTLWYEEGQDGRETITCPGVIGVGADTLAAARRLNELKDTFKAAVLALKTLRKSEADAILTELIHKRDTGVAHAMRRMGAARLNLKQAYRHVPLLERRPAKVGFTWSRQGRTIQRISVAEARRLLERRSETPQTRQELERLSRLPAGEPLARVRPVCPHLRANVVFGDHAQPSRRLIQTPLPLLVPLSEGQPLPSFVAVPPEPVATSRLRRSDTKLEEEPFLILLQVFRYRLRYR